jgi:hypothetical protein
MALCPCQLESSTQVRCCRLLKGAQDKISSLTCCISVQEIRLVCRRMDGVAYTTGSHTHKEIHLSVEHVSNSRDRAEHEVRGVLVHEVVHCFQYNGRGTAPGGLIEGIAGEKLHF